MSNWMRVFCALLALAAPMTAACAAETEQLQYTVLPENLPPAGVASLLRAGVPLGQALPKPAATQLPGLDRVTSFFPALTQANARESAQVQAVIQRALGAPPLTGAPGGAGGSSSNLPSQPLPPAPPAPGGDPGLATSPPDLAKFRSCAQRALPMLRALLGAEQVATDPSDPGARAAMLAALAAELDRDRADGARLTPGGVFCGRFLARAGFAKPALLDELKIALAFSARAEASDLATLEQALVVSRKSDAPAEARRLWSYFWERLSVLAVFGASDQPLPSPEKLRAELGARDESTRVGVQLGGESVAVQVGFALGAGELDAALRAGRAYSEGVAR